MTRKEELKSKLSVLETKYDELWDAGLPFEEWYAKAKALSKDMCPLLGQLHVLEDEYELHDIPEYGDKFELKHFVDCCKCYGFIDNDGDGYYATEDKESNIPARPSEIILGYVRNDFPYVIWYNK